MEPDESRYQELRQRMVEEQLVRRGIVAARVLQAMRAVPRHMFVPTEYRDHAYEDMPLPVGSGQTISQPYIVALMTSLLDVQPGDAVLEVGTGSGYQAAILGWLAEKVHTIECVPDLALAASQRLKRLGISNVDVHCGDGSRGLPERAPFDAILVPAAAPRVPQPLLEQLADGGRLVLPIGSRRDQHLQLWMQRAGRCRRRVLSPVRFVPLVGEWGWDAPLDSEDW